MNPNTTGEREHWHVGKEIPLALIVAIVTQTATGIFASRHPSRPNGIGMSIVKLIRREGNVLIVEGADMLDETPLLDIKPYIPKYDAIPSASEGWTANKQWRQKPEGRE